MAYTVAHMLANNYPERLVIALFYLTIKGTIFIVNAPWLFTSFWNLCSQWLKPVTKDKVCFVNDSKECCNAFLKFRFATPKSDRR
jgi:hypothetical protein